MTQYLMRVYDTHFNDVRNETIIECANDEAAIKTAKRYLHLSIRPLDNTCEIQVCRKDASMGEWCMFAAVYYENKCIVGEAW